MTAARGERASAAAAQAPAGDADAAAATAAAAAAGPAAAAAAAAEAHHHAADAPAGPLDSAGSLAQGGDYHHHHANGGGAAAAAPPPPGGVVLLGHHQQHRHPHPHHRHHQHQHHAEPQTLGDISVRSGRSAASAASSKAPAGALHIEVADDEPPESVQAALEDAYQHPPARATRGAQARAFFRKMRGGLDHRLKVPHPTDLVFSWIGAFAGIAVVSLLDRLLWSAAHFPLLVASFGASAVLVYGVPESKLAQPWNFFGGQVRVCAPMMMTRTRRRAGFLGAPRGARGRGAGNAGLRRRGRRR